MSVLGFYGKPFDSRGDAKLVDAKLYHISSIHAVSHKEFMTFQDRVLSMLASLESRVEVLTKHEEKLRQEVAIYKTALSARVMATHEALRVEVPNPHTFSGQ